MEEAHLWRLAECGKLMRRDRANRFEVLLLMSPANMSYFTGNDRPNSYVMVTKNGASAAGIPENEFSAVRSDCTFDHIKTFTDQAGMLSTMAEYYRFFEAGDGGLGLELSRISPPMLAALAAAGVKPDSLEVRDCAPLVSRMRQVKEESEVVLIRAAARVASAGMAAISAALEEGVTEMQLAVAAESAMREAGADGIRAIEIATGPRTCIARPRPTSRRLELDELMTAAVYPAVGGYTAALARTICLSIPGPAQQEAFAAYRGAQQEAIAAAVTGASVEDLEHRLYSSLRQAAPSCLSIGPALGGIGIEAQEAPQSAVNAFFPEAGEALPFKPNTVIAAGGCGLYCGTWGLRLEDTVVVTPSGPEVLTEFHRELTRVEN